jgi:hypothetical protein
VPKGIKKAPDTCSEARLDIDLKANLYGAPPVSKA